MEASQFETIWKTKNVRIDLNKETGVTEIVLHRGKQLNTITPSFISDIENAFLRLDTNPSVRVIILWAEGRLFTAGLDLKEAFSEPEGGEEEKEPCPARRNLKLYRKIKEWQKSFDAIYKSKKPVIAAIHGHCIGGGVDIVAACDIRVCTEDATFSIMETQIGIVADLGTLQRISRLVGDGIAKEMAFSSVRLPAERALRCGLVNSVHENKEKMLSHARDLAQRIANLSPLVVQATKHIMNYSREHSLEDGLEYVALWNTAFLQSQDLVEATSAFFNKNVPKFRSSL